MACGLHRRVIPCIWLFRRALMRIVCVNRILTLSGRLEIYPQSHNKLASATQRRASRLGFTQEIEFPVMISSTEVSAGRIKSRGLHLDYACQCTRN